MASKCTNIKFFTLLLAILANCDITMHMYRIGVLTTIEERFGFSAWQLGVTLSLFELGSLPSALLLSYFCRRNHVPRLMAVSACFIAVAGLLMSLPHFIYGSGDRPDNASSVNKDYGGLCVNTTLNGTGRCVTGKSDAGMSYPLVYALLIISSIFLGIGYGPIGTVGLTFLESNVLDKSTAPAYIGIINGAMAMAAFTGFLFATFATRIYINPGGTWPLPGDPGWLGAWWLGSIVIGAVAGLTLPFFFLFLPSLVIRRRSQEKDKTAYQEKQLKEASQQGIEEIDQGLKLMDMDQENPDNIGEKNGKTTEGMRGILAGLKRLFTNSLYIVMLICMALDFYFWSGFLPYIPKYLESQFRLESYLANLLTAVMSGLAAAIGALSGGMVASRLPSDRLVVRFMLVVSLVSSGGLFLAMCISCNTPPIITESSLACNVSCQCSTLDWWPVCGSNGQSYRTPCIAGCSEEVNYSQSINFTNCACAGGGWAATGACTMQCNLMYVYAAVLFVLSVLANMNLTPMTALILKVVDDNLKSFSLGVMNAVLSILAFLPGPAIFGAAVDALCIFWQTDECGSNGSCFAYDIHKFRYAIHGLTGFYKALAVLGYIFICFRYKASITVVVKE